MRDDAALPKLCSERQAGSLLQDATNYTDETTTCEMLCKQQQSRVKGSTDVLVRKRPEQFEAIVQSRNVAK